MVSHLLLSSLVTLVTVSLNAVFNMYCNLRRNSTDLVHELCGEEPRGKEVATAVEGGEPTGVPLDPACQVNCGNQWMDEGREGRMR